MKLRMSVALRQGSVHDVTLACDVTTTVADVAHELIRAGLCDSALMEEISRRRLAPITLRAWAENSERVLLDPMSPLGESGVQSGWTIQPTLEFGETRAERRIVDTAGHIEVRSGEQQGVQFSLIAGSNLIGRDRPSRVHLLDQSVSRRHATIEIGAGPGVLIRDLGSANGTLIGGDAIVEHRILSPTTVHLGEVELRITPTAPVAIPASQEESRAQAPSHQFAHIRAPRVSPHFPVSVRDLPAPPPPPQPSRMPMVAMLAPMLLGGAMYAVTRSPMSLMMIAFSPMMMLGSWLDNRWGGRRKHAKSLAQFAEELSLERAELTQLQREEISVRATETPTLDEIKSAIAHRDELLWARRPEHRSFLEVRFGEGQLRSRTEIVLPQRGNAARELWNALQCVKQEFESVAPVPVIERFDRCGSIGVAGDRIWAEGMAAALVLQLVGLHSPDELAIACFAGPQHEHTWNWLKWLPHVDPVASPVTVWQLADEAKSSAKLLTALEGLLETRKARAQGTPQIRSHLSAETRNDAGQGDAVTGLPTTPSITVLVLEHSHTEVSRLIELAENGPDFGIHLIWVAQHRSLIPAACRTLVEVEQACGRVHFVRTGTVVPLSRIEYLDPAVAGGLARRLAPVEDSAARMLDESDLPRSVQLRDLHQSDILSGHNPILRSWEANRSLTASWRVGNEQAAISLSAVVGQSPQGPAVIDLRAQGPHALVGGTTGAGKSEFLQTWIMSMAANVSPERLTFLLVDYKGGAAFAECVELPHTVGLVTDLGPYLVRRALTSLRAELRHREELLAKHGMKDLVSMERQSDPAAPPALIIVIDEFAALARDVPEFVEGVVDIAQRGRSLGLHLIMATQRPAGVITDNLRANTNLRIALRMADEADSADVIGVNDAAFFDPDTPGRSAIKVGPGRISHLQAGYLGGRATRQNNVAQIELRSLGFTEGDAWQLPPERLAPGRKSQFLRDIERLRNGIVGASRAAGLALPRRPWLDELPSTLDLDELFAAHGGTANPALLGLRDDPAAQAQNPVYVDFENVGNLAVIGAGGTGKTSALFTLAASLSRGDANDPVHLYAIDGASGTLEAIHTLPTVGAVAPLGDQELVTRLLRHLLQTIAERGPKFAAARASGLDSYRKNSQGSPEARVVLLLDGFAAFRQASETLRSAEHFMPMLAEIMMNGRAVGVHVIITSDRPAANPASISSTLQQQFVLRLTSPNDYAALGINGDALDDAPAGRAIAAGDDRTLQVAVLGGNGDIASQSRELELLGRSLNARGVHPAPQIRNAPTVIPLERLPVSHGENPVFGITVESLDAATLPLCGLGVIAGPSGSGLSQAALTCVAALERFAHEHDETLDAALLSFDDDGLQHKRQWSHLAVGGSEVEALAATLTVAIGGAVSRGSPLGGSVGGYLGSGSLFHEQASGELLGAADGAATESIERDPPVVFSAPGKRGVIVVERAVMAEGSRALPELVALAKAARRAGVLVLFEFEMGAASAIWELYQVLKQPTWGLSLQPDEAESQSPFRENLGRVKRTGFPPGRGMAIERGSVTAVHVALARGPSKAQDAPAAKLSSPAHGHRNSGSLGQVRYSGGLDPIRVDS